MKRRHRIDEVHLEPLEIDLRELALRERRFTFGRQLAVAVVDHDAEAPRLARRHERGRDHAVDVQLAHDLFARARVVHDRAEIAVGHRELGDAGFRQRRRELMLDGFVVIAGDADEHDCELPQQHAALLNRIASTPSRPTC